MRGTISIEKFKDLQCWNTHMLIVCLLKWCHRTGTDSSGYGVRKFLLGKRPLITFSALAEKKQAASFTDCDIFALSSFWSLCTTVVFWSAGSTALWTRRSPQTLAPSPLSSHFSFALWCAVFLSACPPRSALCAAAAKGGWLFRGRSEGLKVSARLPAADGHARDHIQPWL